jgi:hypothetical protein
MVPFDDQRHRSSNMAAMAAILDLVSVDYLTNACASSGPIFWWLIGGHHLHHVPLLPKPYLPYTHRQLPTLGHMPCLIALPLFSFTHLIGLDGVQMFVHDLFQGGKVCQTLPIRA